MRNKSISKKRQKLIDDKINSPLTVGELISVNRSALSDYKSKSDEGRTENCIILKMQGDQLIVRYEDNSVYKRTYKISIADIAGRNLYELGANPFDESGDTIRPVAFTLESVLFNLNVFNEKDRVHAPFEFDGVICHDLNWNPFIYNSKGEKEYYQRPFCWTLNDKQLLVESIYQGIDCGKILVRKRAWKEILDMREKGETELAFTDIVDGKQRLNVKEFILGEFPDMQGNYFGDLSYKSQNMFTNHQLFSYAEMPENTKDSDIIKQFLKMNFCGVPQSKEHIEFVKSLQGK